MALESTVGLLRFSHHHGTYVLPITQCVITYEHKHNRRNYNKNTFLYFCKISLHMAADFLMSKLALRIFLAVSINKAYRCGQERFGPEGPA